MAAFTPKIIRQVTVPLLKFAVDVPLFIRSEGKIYKGKEIKGTKGGVKMEPADLMRVVNLETGEIAEVIVGALFKDTLTEEYPDHAYVGKCFSIVQKKIEGKRYKGYVISEIEAPASMKK